MITIFNSWQSDVSQNRKGVRIALNDACNNIYSQFADVDLNVIDSSSNQVGTTHIPNAILESIAKADIFIADLTTVGVTTDGKKKLQNPNVLVELGYAVSQLGWERIVVLFNKTFGDFKDLPFDIEKRSCLDFKIADENDKGGIGQLREDLIARLARIIEVNPDKPKYATEIIDKPRANDIQIVKKILSWFPISSMDGFLKDGSSRFKKSMLSGYTSMEEMVTSKGYYVNDLRLKKRIVKLVETWASFNDIVPNSYTLEGDVYVDNTLAKQKKGSMLSMIWIRDIDNAYVSLVKFVRKEFPEIDI
ncbi:MAG: hypothetical protein WDO14_24305 [Bacteroidota bacterium]